MRRLLPLTAASLLLACSTPQEKPADKADTPVEQPAPPPSPPQLILNGQPIALVSALAYTTGSSEIRVELSDAPHTCAEVRGRAEGRTYVTAAFAPLLQPDGTRRWSATLLVLGERNLNTPEQLQGLTITPPADGQPIALQLAHQADLPADEQLELPAARTELRGAVSAQRCGALTRDVPNAIAQDKLTATLAGQPLTFRGAILTGSPDNPRLELSTSPRDCDGWQPSDLDVFIRLNQKSGKHNINVKGDILSEQYADSVALDLRRDANDPAKLTIEATYPVVDQPLVLSGTINALDCTTK